MHPPTSEDSGQAPAGTGQAPPRSRLGRLWRRLPRTETVLLLLGLGWTLGAKFLVVRKQRPDEVIGGVLEAVLPDLAFFAAVAAVFAALHLLGGNRLVRRLTLVVASIVLAWSMANAAWMIATRVQLQPSVLRVLVRDPAEFWPIVQSHLVRRPEFGVPIVATIVLGAAWLLWRLVRPAELTRGRRAVVASLGAALALTVVTVAAHAVNVRSGRLAYSGEVLGFSSHWYAILWTASEIGPSREVEMVARVVPRAGERAVRWSGPPPDDPPNVVVVFLESVSSAATSLTSPRLQTTPFLEELAGEGVQLESTHVPVAQTSKAWWAGLTGSMPDLQPDFAEAVLVDRPYESLATLLGARGYRSAFFEMSRGSFECAPGLFSNLAFDWAWFRENLEDESAHLGYMNGDDFRMLDPMFEWVDRDESPFLLATISSVAHDPYELPRWCGQAPADDAYGRYLQTVRFTDDWLRELCSRLESRGLLQDTLLCVIGDHGEGFRPEGGLGRWAPFEEVIRVPWIIRFPGRVDGGQRVQWPSSQLDVTPTILSLLGADVSEAGFDGRDALAEGAADRVLHFTSWYRDSPLGRLEGGRKLVYWPYTNTLFEYDLAQDPAEKSPRTIEGPERDRIAGDLVAWRERHELHIPARRFRESMEYEHWRTVSSGRYAWAYYLP